MNLRKQTGLSTFRLSNFLVPEHFDDIVRAALTTASPGFDDEDLKSPSTAIKLGYDIKRMLGAKWSMTLSGRDEYGIDSCKKLMKLMKLNWALKVTKLATVTLTCRQFNKVKSLPLPDDLVKLQDHIKNEIKELDLKSTTKKNFNRVIVLSETRLLLYNKRRSGEVEAIR